ncbi:hypothetical protein HDA31_002420 [Micromonospora carbonacea subsp. aurantiaca]|uniref:Uncharacterized protein n=1 Tax=Micromonospora carbonacea TaxID=47853 RepID=A0A1C4VTQ0_9ACTN|nr:hypothetical protein [Micromonospora carbonacea]SCE87394.1 hypothetical protein GA0070563_102518 [Micromonospora carbonacea]
MIVGYGGYPDGPSIAVRAQDDRPGGAGVRHADAAHPEDGVRRVADGTAASQRCGSTLTRASSASR